MPAPPDEWVGIVVARHDYGEQDRVIRLLTAEDGIVGLFAPGARRGRSPFAAVDLGGRVRVRAREGRGELRRLVDAEVEDGRVHLRRSLAAMLTAAYACEVCGALAQPGHAEPRLYGLLETALLLLDAASADPADAFLAALEAKALTFAGFPPVLDRCLHCARPLDGPLVFEVPHGAAHAGCRGEAPGRREPVTSAWLAAVEAARRRPLRESLDEALPPGPTRILGDAVEAHVGRALHSRVSLAMLGGA